MPLLLRLTVRLLRLKHYSIVLLTLLLVLVSSTLAVLLEPETFGSWFNALWWVMTTVATVGYGDYYPETIPGKVLAMLLYVFGIGLLSLLIGKIYRFHCRHAAKKGRWKVEVSGTGPYYRH